MLPDSLPTLDAGATARLNKAHDTCQGPLQVDVSKLPVQVLLDPAGAKNDYGLAGCAGAPDLVMQLINGPSHALKFSCTGVPSVGVFKPTNNLCPGSYIGSQQTQCNGSAFKSVAAANYPIFFVVCAAGSATLRIDKL